MNATMRVGQALNRALHQRMAAEERLFLLGQDIADPYGGAFGITRGLSSRFPQRVISMPISEGAIVGAAGGLALAGNPVLVEIMFGDFITLCTDMLVNFVSKSVAMYGRRLPMPLLVRCPVGGNRGYGPTHSQSLGKILFGVPHLSLLELSPFHDPADLLDAIARTGEPAVLFEDKVLYTTPCYSGGVVDDVFRFTALDECWVQVTAEESPPQWVVVAPGGLVPRVLPALRAALLEDEVTAQLLVPARLFPVDLEPVMQVLRSADRILIVEDGVAGGGWASELAQLLYGRLWGQLRNPVTVLQPACTVLPAARHLEREVLVQDTTIYRALTGVHCG